MRCRINTFLLATAMLALSCGSSPLILPPLGALPALDASGDLTIPPEIQAEYAELQANPLSDIRFASMAGRRAGMYLDLNNGLYSQWQYIGLGLFPTNHSLHNRQAKAFAASIGGHVDSIYTDATLQGFSIVLPHALSMQRCAQVGEYAFAIFGEDLQSIPEQTWDLNLPGST